MKKITLIELYEIRNKEIFARNIIDYKTIYFMRIVDLLESKGLIE